MVCKFLNKYLCRKDLTGPLPRYVGGDGGGRGGVSTSESALKKFQLAVVDVWEPLVMSGCAGVARVRVKTL